MRVRSEIENKKINKNEYGDSLLWPSNCVVWRVIGTTIYHHHCVEPAHPQPHRPSCHQSPAFRNAGGGGCQSIECKLLVPASQVLRMRVRMVLCKVRTAVRDCRGDASRNHQHHQQKYIVESFHSRGETRIAPRLCARQSRPSPSRRSTGYGRAFIRKVSSPDDPASDDRD